MRELLVVIDTDTGFYDRFEEKLEEQNLSDKYEIYRIVPKTTLETNKLILDCVTNVNKLIEDGKKIAGVFVDIVINEKGPGPLDKSGIMIAAELRSKHPMCPIFNITGRFDSEKEYDTFSEASLEDIDGVFIKTYLEGKYFSAKRLKNTLGKALIKRGKYTKQGKSDIEISKDLIEGYSLVDRRVINQIQEIGENRFWNLLHLMFSEAEGTISYMDQGKSGAYIFKMNIKFKNSSMAITRSKALIVKISSNSGLLEKEVRNYGEITKTPVPKSYFPKLLTNGLVVYQDLSGIALELEEDAHSLFNSFHQLNKDDISGIPSQISSILLNMYGDPEWHREHIWTKGYSLKPLAGKLLSALEKNKLLFEEYYTANRYKRIYDFIESDGSSEPGIFNLESEIEYRNIHGDFNSKNILINNHKSVVLIDFSSFHKSHFVKDIAKLERDIVFRIYDSPVRSYYDWSRIEVWKDFIKLINSKKIFSLDLGDGDFHAESLRSINFIIAIRKILREISPSFDYKEYLLALLYYSIISIAHSEVSIHKKVFALEYINTILDELS